LVDQVGPSVGRGEFTVESVSFLAFQPVDPVQGG
jgi:hypothetical protein